MKIENIQNVITTYNKIKDLDAEIIEIEKHAGLIANGFANVDLSLTVQNTLELEKEDNEIADISKDYSDPFKVSMDSFIQKMTQDHIIQFPTGGISSTKQQKPNSKEFLASISETVALEVLGILLAEKLKIRNELLNTLNRLGVQNV